MFKVVGFLILCLGLVSCQLLSDRKLECEVGSWTQLGKRDVLNGYPSSRFFDRIESCGNDNYEQAFKLYNQGYNEQKKDYCTANGGYTVGLYNRNYSGICTHLDAEFLASYQKGLLAYQIKKKITRELYSYSQISSQIKEQKFLLHQLVQQLQQSNKMSIGELIAKEIATKQSYIEELSDELFFLDKALKKHQKNLKKLEKLN